MKPSSIKKAKDECERFLVACRRIESRGTHTFWDSHLNRSVTATKVMPDQHYDSGKMTAAIKRASLDLQAVLTDLRMGRI
jgi:hypothetical protein